MTRMFARLFPNSRQRALPSVPPGYRVYAIGDVHGRDDLLAALLGQIEADHHQRGTASAVIVFLGDLIDRGPDSAAVVDRLMRYAPDWARPVFLAGNHEEVLLRLLDGDDRVIGDWLRFGGAECCASYGIDAAALRRMGSRRAGETVRAAVPKAHAAFLRGFSDTLSLGDYLFVHAGIRPGLPLDSQAQSDLRWIRQPFLSDISDHGYVVVHGHTVSDGIDEAANRVGIDTGAYRSGILTAFCAEGSQRWFIQTGPNAAKTSDASEVVATEAGAC